MALSKPAFLSYLNTLTRTLTAARPHRLRPCLLHLRALSFATPEEAAAERRRRKRRLRIEPPLLNSRAQPRAPPSAPPNPNAPKLPEPVSALSGNRLNLHNKILKLVRENDLDEAALYTRHSVYSNCRPTIYTVNAVLSALIRQLRYSDFLALHRFITQAGIAPNIITYNLLIGAYCDCRKTDTALEHYKVLVNDAPFSPSTTTYRILVKGLVDSGKVERAAEIKDEMLEKGFSADTKVYAFLMAGHAKEGNADGVFAVYSELKEKLGVGEDGVVEDGMVYGSLMRAYFLKGMESEAMEWYDKAVGELSQVKMNAVGYNSVLEALSKNGKFEEALRLFDRMMEAHSPPEKLTVNIGSFNVMVEGYCALGKFHEAIGVFRRMGERRCSPDTLSFNVLIERLCENDMLAEGEELFREMGEKGVKPDEYTYVLLMDACFKADRPDDAAEYYRKMIDGGLRPNLAVYKKLVEGLVKVGKVDEAKSFFDIMVKKLRMDSDSYQFIMNALSVVGKLDDVVQIVDGMLDEEVVVLDDEMKEFVTELLGKEGREGDLEKLIQEKERIKAEAKAKEAEAAERAKASARAAVASLTSSKLLGGLKDNEAPAEKSVEASSSSSSSDSGGDSETEEAEIAKRDEEKTQEANPLTA
uniref:Pentatricopeptide repeat-containing protein n=1 Tax=Kalanchoe fedtschenkoi TaxID=63787 RepID=A0A7N0ZZC2_KALFE